MARADCHLTHDDHALKSLYSILLRSIHKTIHFRCYTGHSVDLLQACDVLLSSLLGKCFALR